MAGGTSGVPGVSMPGDFIAVRCPECENEQTVFGKAATTVSCAVCGEELASPRGGKSQISGEILDVIQAR